MKLLTCQLPETPGKDLLGLYLPKQNQVLPLTAAGISYRDMNELIERITDAELTQLAAISLKDAAPEGALPYDTLVKRSPIPVPRQDVICLGINYAAHAIESARYKKEAFERDRKYAVYFSKRVNEAVPDGGSIPCHRDLTERLDYEAELAVILGKDAKDVSEEDAFDYVFGYTILNDISAREVQTLHKQWYFGKSLDGFTPIGPWIVTKEEFDQPPILPIRSYVNGELRQSSDTGMLLFSIAQIISELSSGMTLKAGTIISTGTPAGVGMGFEPPKFLNVGDTVTCEIEGIGSITNQITES